MIEYQYEIDVTLNPMSCLPCYLDKSNLRNITDIADTWRKYIDVSTGQIHDCEVYYNMAMNDR